MEFTHFVPTILYPVVTQEGVLEVLRQMKSKMAAGPDSIQSFLLKDCSINFARPLSGLFTLCLETGTFPMQ